MRKALLVAFSMLLLAAEGRSQPAPSSLCYLGGSQIACNSVGNAAWPPASTPTAVSSGNVAAAAATATIPAVPGKTAYLCRWDLTSSGSTAATVVVGTVTGLSGGTLSYPYVSVAGATTQNAQFLTNYAPLCLPASGLNVAIVVSFPSLGAGNTNAAVNAYGFYQ